VNPASLDQLKSAAVVLQDELGLGWKVWVAQYPEGARLVAQKWPPREGDTWVREPSLEAARKRIAEREEGSA
jgi:predicted lysophospholipase L1 biosynthesis ABC-type transport system permease subunit